MSALDNKLTLVALYLFGLGNGMVLASLLIRHCA